MTWSRARKIAVFLVIAPIVLMVVAIVIVLALVYWPRASPQLAAPILARALDAGDFSTEEIGSISYIYKNPKATERAFTQFRKHYPNSDMSVMADGGTD